MTDFLKDFAPYVVGILTLIVVGLFVMFRSDAVRAGEKFPTRLAVQQTLSSIRHGRMAVRGTPEPPARPRTSDELKATISAGEEIRAEDIDAIIAKRRSKDL
jgi:hypothetical protein